MKATAGARKVNMADKNSLHGDLRLFHRGHSLIRNLAPPLSHLKSIATTDAFRIRACKNRFAMSLGHAKGALAIAAILLFASAAACAQEGAMPLPDPSYGNSADSYKSPTDLPMPAPDDLTNPDTVTIPIPGGGEITVDGPDAPGGTPLPTLPGSQWGTSQQTPFSHDIGPIGP